MNPRERALLVGLGTLVAVLAVALTVLTMSSGNSSKAATAATTARASIPPEPTTTAAPTTPAPTTAAPTTVAPTTVAPTTMVTATAQVLDQPVTAAGALLTPPPAPDARREDAPNDCASLADAGWQSLDCKAVTPGAGGITYLVEVNPSPAYIATRAYVFRAQGDGSEQVLLEAEDDNGSRYVASEVEAAVVDTGEGQPVLLMGFLEDNGDRQAVDIVRANGTVAAHLDLAEGVVLPAPGGLETWSATSGDRYAHDVLRDTGGAWRMVNREFVAGDVVPHNDNVLA